MQFTRRYLFVGHAVFWVFGFLALWFAEERVLLTDSAYQLFHDINSGGMLINDNRFSMVLSQVLPWLMIRLHIPLRWLIVGYSASFVLICYACYLLVAHLLKNPVAAVLMVFVFLGVGATFFHCISETFQLMFYAPLLYALMRYDAGDATWRQTLRWLTIVVVEALAFFIHPVAAFFVLFLIVWQIFDGKQLHIDATVIVTAVNFVLLLVIKLLAGQSGHDESFIPTGETLKYALGHFFHLNSMGFFFSNFTGYYLFPTLLWLITLVGYARNRNWWKLAFVGLFTIGFFAMSVVVYWEGDGPIGMERSYLPLFFFVGLPFLEDEWPRMKARWQQWIFLGCFVILLVHSILRIGSETPHYVDRLQEIKKMAVYARGQGQYKIIITRSTAEAAFPFNIWGLALESMLYTARDGADQTVTIYMEEDDFDRTDADLYQNPDVYVSVNWWKKWSVHDLNPYYFQLPAQGYMELKKIEEGYQLAPLSEIR